MKDFRISNTLSARNLDAAAELLAQPRLWVPNQGGDYPDHLEWRDKALAEIEKEKKIAMVAFWGMERVAICVYQQDPRDSSRVEIRNLSVEASARGRGLAPFVLRQVECEAPHDFPGTDTLIADVKRTNIPMAKFAVEQGFTIEDMTILSGNFTHSGVEDIVLSKSLTGPLPFEPGSKDISN